MCVQVVCVQVVCEQVRGGGGRRRREEEAGRRQAGCRTKNKNPTQRDPELDP